MRRNNKWRGNPKYRKSWRSNTLPSKGELLVREKLDSMHISYMLEVEFKLLKNHSFDIYIPKERTIIEIDGKQHYSPNNPFHKGDIDLFNLQAARDVIKNNFCHKMGIKLIRLKYNNLKDLEKRIEKAIVPKKLKAPKIKKCTTQKQRDNALIRRAMKDAKKNQKLPTTTIDGKVFYRRLKKIENESVERNR